MVLGAKADVPSSPAHTAGAAAGTTGQSCTSSRDASTAEETKAGQDFSPALPHHVGTSLVPVFSQPVANWCFPVDT